MTVAELIKQLEKMPQSMRVVLQHPDEGYDEACEASKFLVKPVNNFYCGEFDAAKQSDFGVQEVCLII